LVVSRLDALWALGINVRVTEFSVDTLQEALYGDYLRDYLTVMFSHPAVDGFLMWGFWDQSGATPSIQPYCSLG
jgi:endo-1,4-beta-xylanase